MIESANELEELLGVAYNAKPFAEPIDDCLRPENLELNHCVKCGKGVPHYCEKCHQDLIGENARLQYHLTKTIPTEENEVRLQNIVEHFEKIKHSQSTVEINEDDIKAIKELTAVKEHLKHKYESYYKLYWEESVPLSAIQNKIDEINEEIKHEDNEKVIIWLHKQRKVLQELLEEIEEKENGNE